MAHSITNDHNNSTPPNVLLAIDNKNSVLAEVVAGQTNHIAYSAYGYQSARQEVMTRLGFNGELREMHTSWYLLGNGYRAYNPRLMRFHSPDKLSPFGAGGLNAYMYCGGEPVMNSDPTGHTFFSWKNVFQILDFFSLSNNSSGPLRNPLPIEAASGSGGLWGAAATLASRAPGPGGVSSTPIGKNPPLHGTSGPTSNYRPSRPALTGVGALVDSVGFSGSTSRTYPTFLSSGNTHTQ
ncbi:RHS repeat-associated core domain-containing protein, partial [Pseudomonas fluorescens]